MAFIWNTDLPTEILVFSVDAILSYFFYKSYNKTSTYIQCLQDVISKGENKDVEQIQTGEKRYTMVQGPVKSLGNNIISVYAPNMSGVVQRMSTNEYVMTRNSSGYWMDQSRPIHQSYNTVPFAIVVGSSLIEVKDVLLADELHLDTVYSRYDPMVHSLAANMWSFFSGIRRYGLETTEEMLKEGTIVTGIGELAVLENGTKALLPPGKNKPFFIITQSVATILSTIRDKKMLYGALLVITGTLTAASSALLIRRLWIHLKKKRESADLRRRLRERRRNARTHGDNIPQALQCIVCQDNPREVIMLPCGHLCVCEDCSAQLGSTCPVCRAHIATRAAAFLS
ncbi:mitochondrial E3 ubiquitin protein ligase 1-like [Macrosteles quadrilineatus]|uniref:mitochondrial E3 ubiquitin protein ligase 1-like n=1 Tax=Macrosteles quadrilineatus TaxID=74068 RepID=UPI0023E32308|nr:mitochondrial E3 ubiquitin protein ligase 1-like [Macrosteles quadrilineatus]